MRVPGFTPWAVLVGAMAFFLLWPVPQRSPDAPRGPRVLVDRVVIPGADGVALAFTLSTPGKIELRARGPEDAALRLALGPPLRVDGRTGRFEPDPELAVTLHARGEGVLHHALEAVGTYVVKVLPVPTAMEPMTCRVHVQVVLTPAFE